MTISALANELKRRYEPLRAVTLVGRLIQKAMFAGRSDDVLLWALVFAHYRGSELGPHSDEQIATFRAELLSSLKTA